jgi:hypothetical protein
MPRHNPSIIPAGGELNDDDIEDSPIFCLLLPHSLHPLKLLDGDREWSSLFAVTRSREASRLSNPSLPGATGLPESELSTPVRREARL